MMVEDEVAQKLEAMGLWRRAASRWLDIMQSHDLSDKQREWVRQRRKNCLSCAKPISSPDKLDVAEIVRAAKATQERMGLSQPDGAAFRLKDRQYNHRTAVLDVRSPEDNLVIGGSEDTAGEVLAHTHGIDIVPDYYTDEEAS